MARATGPSTAPGPSLTALDRKRTGAWYTPPDLVERVVDAVVTPAFVADRGTGGRRLRVLDPACGDGRFLAAVAERVRTLGGSCDLVGVDVDPAAIDAAVRIDGIAGARLVVDDSLDREWDEPPFDLVVGNPPFLSQMAAATTRRGASRHGGGPYADAAAEFLALAATLVDPRGGRLAFVLPQSILSARDAGDVRAAIDRRASMTWSWWSPDRLFDAQVLVCAVAFEFGGAARTANGDAGSWSHVVTARTPIPDLPEPLGTRGTLGDRAWLNANFRDEYYGMIPAVGDHAAGPPLVTSGLIDPGRCRWGRRPVRFAKRRFAAPRIDLDALDADMRRWAARRLVPKVLVANQTRVIEAVCDPDGAWLPGVPVVGVYPNGGDAGRAWEIAAVLTSPFASVWAWHRRAGSGLSAGAIRVGPGVLADLPWPAGDLDRAADELRAGDVVECGRAVSVAYGIDADGEAGRWWSEIVVPLAAP